MTELTNKTVLITGASSGIGAACAEAFARAGARLILCARREEAMQRLVDQLAVNHAIETVILKMDVTDSAAVQQDIDSLQGDWSNIDLLINNAGLALGFEPLQDGNIENWETMIDTNVKGLLYVTKSVLPRMLQRNIGHIINIGSIAGQEVYPRGAVYCASKHAVRALSEGMRKDLLGTAIKVSTIDPGAVNTDFSLVRFKGDREMAERVYEGMTPLLATDVADAVLYCATRPAHVNVSELTVLPQNQASATMIFRQKNQV